MVRSSNKKAFKRSQYHSLLASALLLASSFFLAGCDLNQLLEKKSVTTNPSTPDPNGDNSQIPPVIPTQIELGSIPLDSSQAPVVNWPSGSSVPDNIQTQFKVVSQDEVTIISNWQNFEIGDPITGLTLPTDEPVILIVRAEGSTGLLSQEVKSLPWIPGSDGCFDTKISSSPFAGGDGSSGSPYVICTPVQLEAINDLPDTDGLHFKLSADLNLATSSFEGLSSSAQPFGGIFHGENRRIKNFTVLSASADHGGFFKSMYRAVVQNLIFEDPQIILLGFDFAGILAGECTRSHMSGIIINSASLSGDNYVGGIIGGSSECSVFDSEFNGAISATGYGIGGVAGYSERGDFFNINGTINITGTSSTQAVGSVIGAEWWDSPRIQNAHFVGDISGGDSVGGLVGETWDGLSIYRSSFIGNITGISQVGGLVGAFGDSPFALVSSFFEGNISGNNQVGGLFGGYYYWGTIRDSYTKATITGTGASQHSFGGIVGTSDYYGTLERIYADYTIDSNSSSVGGYLGYSTSGQSQGMNFNDSFVVGSVTGSSSSDFISLGVGFFDFDVPASEPVLNNSYYWSNGTCLNTAPGLCRAPSGIAEANSQNFWSSAHPVYSNWNETDVWEFNSTALPTLNFNQNHSPSVSHVCNGMAAAISRNYNCIINVSDLDVNEIRAVSLNPDHTCWWLNFNSLLLSGSPTLSDPTTCRVSFRVTDGSQYSANQSFDVNTTLGVSVSPTPNFPPKYSYASRTVGSDTPVTFTITNNESVTITDFSVSLNGSSEFVFTGGSYPGTTGSCGNSINSATNCTVRISFTPTSVGTKDHYFTVSYRVGTVVYTQHFYIIGYGI